MNLFSLCTGHILKSLKREDQLGRSVVPECFTARTLLENNLWGLKDIKCKQNLKATKSQYFGRKILEKIITNHNHLNMNRNNLELSLPQACRTSSSSFTFSLNCNLMSRWKFLAQESDKPGITCQHCPLSALWLWTTPLFSLSLSSLICTRTMIREPNSYECHRT